MRAFRIGNAVVDLDSVLGVVEDAARVAATLRRIQNGGAATAARAPNGRRTTPRRQAEEYARKHGGHDGFGRPPIRSTYATPDQVNGEPWVVEMGAITRIGYTTLKSDESEDGYEDAEEFIHDFENARPLLCFSSAGLVIVRGRSTYDVRDEGITG